MIINHLPSVCLFIRFNLEGFLLFDPVSLLKVVIYQPLVHQSIEIIELLDDSYVLREVFEAVLRPHFDHKGSSIPHAGVLALATREVRLDLLKI